VQQTPTSNPRPLPLLFPPGAADPPPIKSSRKRWAAVLIGVAFSVTLPVLAFQGVNVSQSWDLILESDGVYLALGGLCFLGTLWFRSWRWKYLLAAQQDVSVRSCLSSTCVGFLANNVLPLRLGDLVRVGALRQLEGGSAAKVLGTVAVERVLEILTLVFFLGTYLAFASAGPHQAELLTAGLLALAGGLFLTAVLVMGYWRRSWLQRLIAMPFGWVSPKLGAKVGDVVGRVLEGVQVFASPGQVARVIVLSLALWGASVGSYYFVGQALGIDIPAEAYVVVVFTTCLGAIIPAAPGAVGTFHSFAWMGLYLVGLHSGEQALAFAGLLHATEWTLMNMTGLAFLWRDRLHLAAVSDVADSRSESPTYVADSLHESAGNSRSESATKEKNDATPTVPGGEPRPAHHPQPV
jgi:uncharacterized protein (TIRG00374 family)